MLQLEGFPWPRTGGLSQVRFWAPNGTTYQLLLIEKLMYSAAVSRLSLVAIVFLVSIAFWITPDAQGERVGYSFEGTFLQPPTSNQGVPLTEYTAFGVTFPLDAPFSGTFSYDTESPSVVPFSGSKDFKQIIQGGFTFNVFDSPGGQRVLKVAANTYTIRATNDFTPQNAPVASDILSVEFNTLLDRTLPPLFVNDAIYPNSMKPLIFVPISWDWTAFTDPDEPKLHGDLPLEIFPYQGAIQTKGTSGASFAIRSISRLPDLPGDYNFDAQFDQSDYAEWRKAFGTTFPYADGNRDSIVDAGDYVEWRAALSHAGSATNSASVPEPATCSFIFAVASLFSVHERRRIRCE